MSEGKQNEATKKRRRFSPKILKGISITLMSIILIVFIYLQAPWKVNVIFIAIILETILLKKSQEKWVWLIPAVLLSALVIWVFLPDDNTGWRPYTFDKELEQMESKRFVPYNENAAVIYNQLFENYDSNSFNRDFLYSEARKAILYNFWKSKDYPEVTSWIKDNQNTIEQLMKVCEKQRCWFPIGGDLYSPEITPPADFETITNSWIMSLGKRLDPMRNWASLIIASANNDVAEGREGLAVQKYIAALQISKHLCQQPAMTDFLSGVFIGCHGIVQIKKMVVEQDVNDIQLSDLEQSLRGIQYNWQVDLNRLIDYEKLMYKSLICAVFYETNSEGKTRLSRDPNATLIDIFNLSPSYNNYWRGKKAKASVIFCWFFVPPKPQKTATIIDDIYKKYYDMASPDFSLEGKPEFLSLRNVKLNIRFYLELTPQILWNIWDIIHDGYPQSDFRKSASLIIIDLKRYKNKTGRWPESLEEIETEGTSEIFIDPINNDGFIYKRAEEGFKLYSKGKNNIDEDGKKGRGDTDIKTVQGPGVEGEEKVIERDDILIWPPEEKKD